MEKRLIDFLPETRGVMKPNYNLRDINWLKVGGNAEVFFCPEDTDDLRYLLKKKPENVQITVIGAGSNILIRDGGVKGIVICFGDWFKKIHNSGENFEVGAATSCRELAKSAAKAGVGGLEFLYAIPGSVGGALKMNAGCFGFEMKDVFVEAEGMNVNSLMKWFGKDDLKFTYRKCQPPKDCIFTRIWVKGSCGDSSLIEENMQKFEEQRRRSHPSGVFTCGSLFKNPPEEKAWKLIEKSGCKNMKCGGASLSEVHCNFLVNDGSATSNDIESLIETIKSKVLAVTGVNLELELVIIGERQLIN
ncbi:MAG: UDP-N-acetylmuramate dehydrogenase [Holosporales bacterium]|jgi:UDP-N-acetylmuramate dehydrogenase|nr:UDP-N-acetylmuramate dehydrogenase [Holosporales bacterium]